jgi:hypothetical protein
MSPDPAGRATNAAGLRGVPPARDPRVHLRLCLTCGHVGCCDSSPMRHARGHAFAYEHAIVQSLEPGEDWRWCYLDETFV